MLMPTSRHAMQIVLKSSKLLLVRPERSEAQSKGRCKNFELQASIRHAPFVGLRTYFDRLSTNGIGRMFLGLPATSTNGSLDALC